MSRGNPQPLATRIRLHCRPMSSAAKSHPPDQGRGPAHLAARPAARHAGAVRRGAAGDRGRGGASRLCADRHHQRHRALPSPHSAGPAFPTYRRADLRQAQSVDKTVFEYWTHALSYVPAKDLRFFIPAMKRHRREGHKWFEFGQPGGSAQGDAADPARRRADHPRHRRRRADGKGASVGQPQAVEAGAATGVLHRRAHDQRAQRHAQDL